MSGLDPLEARELVLRLAAAACAWARLAPGDAHGRGLGLAPEVAWIGPEGEVAPPPAAATSRLTRDLSAGGVVVARLELAASSPLGGPVVALGIASLEAALRASARADLALTTHAEVSSATEGALRTTSARLARATERLAELDRLKTSFLATVSHELKTPLTSILGYAEMLAEEPADAGAPALSTEQASHVAVIRRRGEQLLGLVTSLLELGRLEAGALAVSKVPVLLGPLLDDAHETLTPAARRKGVELSARALPGLPAVAGDAARLRQVLVNLVDNAVKFTPRGGGVRVSASAFASVPDDGAGAAVLAAAPSHVRVVVEDDGIGIPEHERERVFEAFYQVDASATREHGGAGIGLAVVRRIVEAHGGTVVVSGRSPTGTRVTIDLPIARARHEAVP